MSEQVNAVNGTGARCFGIDLGTTNSVIAQLIDGAPTPIPIDGSPIVPSVVLFEGDRVVVGKEARNLELLYPEKTIRSAKRKIGQTFRYRAGDRDLAPEEVSAEVLRALKRGAEEALGESVVNAVITVPAYFDDAQRRSTLRAGELAGLNVLRLLNEPTSAALVYDRVGVRAGGSADQPEIVLVYDLGGGTFDVSVLDVVGDVREVLATGGNTHLGGDDFDDLLVRFFLDELKREQAVDPREDARAMARLRRVAEATKIALSSETVVRVREEFLTTSGGKAVHLEVEISRRQFEALIQPLLASTIDLSRKVMNDARLSLDRVDRVCLVGGSTRIPLVRQLLDETFPAEVHEEIDPDLAVGLGAAIQSALLQGAEVPRILVDVAAHSLGIKALGDRFDAWEADTFAPILRRNTVLPSSRAEEFYTVIDDQEKLNIEVFQGEASRASQNTKVGSFDFPLVPRPHGSPVRVEFAYDLNGVVNVSVSQPGTDNSKTVALQVADAAAAEQAVAAPKSAVERKAEALLETLQGDAQAELKGLLDRLRSDRGDRVIIEDDILDFFLEHESR